MDFELGRRYANQGDAASWFYEALGEVRRIRVSDVPIKLDIVGGGSVFGLLEGVHGPPTGQHGGVTLLQYGEIFGYPCEDIAAFTLLPGIPPDRSDEMRS
jgi:hypothetical protein